MMQKRKDRHCWMNVEDQKEEVQTGSMGPPHAAARRRWPTTSLHRTWPLPLPSSDPLIRSGRLPPAPAADPTLEGCLILVVEDEAVSQMVAQSMLEQLGCTVEIADAGDVGLARILGGPSFDAILMDWHMPNMDGLEVTRLVRLAGHTTPIIGLTANVGTEEQQQALDAGMTAFLGKPFSRGELTERLLDVISPR